MSTMAAIFAGQGAQAPGMGKDLADAHPECKALFARADEVLGYPLSTICFQGPAEDLTKTVHCQPGIFVVSAACLTALRKTLGDFAPVGTAGLSLGEWTALYAAGALSFEDTLRVLAVRGKAMQEACEERAGGMVSVLGLPADKVQEIGTAAGVEMANLNSPTQTVLSGPKENIAKVEALAKQAGARKAIVLNVAGAYHSSLMASAARALESFLAGVEIKAPRFPVISNVTGLPHGSPDEIRKTVVKQVTSPVRWISCVEWLKANQAVTYVEFGPGKVLSGLVGQIHKEAKVTNVSDVPTLATAVTVIKG